MTGCFFPSKYFLPVLSPQDRGFASIYDDLPATLIADGDQWLGGVHDGADYLIRK